MHRHFSGIKANPTPSRCLSGSEPFHQQQNPRLLGGNLPFSPSAAAAAVALTAVK